MPQKFLSIKNFEKYQHFKKANPPWIKLYRSLFLDREFMKLTTPCKYLYIGLVTLASEGCNRVPNDLHFISHRLAINPSEIDLKPLYKAGFLIASESTVYRETISQRQRQSTETETETDSMSRKRDYKADAVIVLEFLNAKTGRQFRPVPSNIDPIIARLKGQNEETEVSVQTCKSIIAKKFRDWSTDEKMAKYLRPETLFNRTKFESYLGELIPCAALNATSTLTPPLQVAPVAGGHLRSL
jgi:uncharacterized phage protein (TIGR02220 family)